MQTAEPVRRLAAIMIADAVGYSKMMAANESGTHATLTKLQRGTIEPQVKAFNGRIVKGTGDGFLAEFASVIDAVRCAIGLQQALAAAASQGVRYRIGVNIGDIIVQDHDIFGDGVNVAARLESLAEAGGLCISKAAHDQIKNKLDAAFTDMGPQQVKNIATPVEAFGLSASAIAAMPAVQALPRAETARPMWQRRGFVAAAAVAAVVAAGFIYWRSQDTRQNTAALEAVLAQEMPSMSAAARRKLVNDYASASPHRALVLAPKAKARWWTADWSSPEIAAAKALERCQIFYGEPCAVLAQDWNFVPKPADGSWPVQYMPKATYAGTYDPAQIPGLRPNDMARPELQNYAAQAEPKAAAFNVHGIMSVVTKVASQHKAEEEALSLCNADPLRKDSDGPCFLYAIGNKVVLGERLTAPTTP